MVISPAFRASPNQWEGQAFQASRRNRERDELSSRLCVAEGGRTFPEVQRSVRGGGKMITSASSQRDRQPVVIMRTALTPYGTV